ncbi:MAG TPA: haloacid dehalogenase-like hydrolase [Chloroflexaceae bacterium]|nr:haloacid dehalogenase-like hydrolase [Chloroflexaceae bacterium]
MDRLILWDVDGTLLSTDGIAAEAMRQAMREVVGERAPMARTHYAGKTDWQIIRESLPSLPPEEIAERLHEFTAAYLGRLEGQRDDLVARSRVFPGVVQALEALADSARQAPLTGNIAAVARLKLECVGLLPFLDLAAGAYGDDHHHRPELVPVAARRAAARYGRPFAGRQIVVVGDTPYDILCGQANGARTVAVATGPFGLEELLALGPDAALPDLRDTDAVVAAMVG